MLQRLFVIFNVFALDQVLPVITLKNNEDLAIFYKKYDWFRVARCDARCTDLKAINLDSCLDWCLRDENTGTCPKDLEKLDSSAFNSSISCLRRCSSDYECSMTQKCCKNGCRTACRETNELAPCNDLPPVPQHLTISDPYYNYRKRNRFKKHKINKTFQVRWKFENTNDINHSYPGTVVYILEEGHQHHRRRSEDIGGELWVPCAHSKRQPIRLRNKLFSPGRWYQFRISAVGANGAKGPSQPSRGYTTTIMPRPPDIPQDVTVTPLSTNNDTLNVKLQWKAPKSAVPIAKYKIFWSRQFFDPIALDAVIVCQQIVSKRKTNLLIRNLKMPNLYFFQIQALSYLDNKTLEGQKSGLVYNTTQTAGQSVPIAMPTFSRMKNYVDDLRIEKIFTSNKSLSARIRWKENLLRKIVKYVITSSYYCKDDKLTSFPKKNYIVSKLSYYDMDNLKFSCRYKVSVRKVLNEKGRSKITTINFTTPKCNDFSTKTDEGLLC